MRLVLVVLLALLLVILFRKGNNTKLSEVLSVLGILVIVVSFIVCFVRILVSDTVAYMLTPLVIALNGFIALGVGEILKRMEKHEPTQHTSINEETE